MSATLVKEAGRNPDMKNIFECGAPKFGPFRSVYLRLFYVIKVYIYIC